MCIRAATLLLASLAIAAGGCGAVPGSRGGPAPDDLTPLLRDDVFLAQPPRRHLDPVTLYALPEHFATELDREIATLSTEELQYRALRRWIFEEADKYEYDPGITVAITDLRRVGRINCFSFSVLYVAAARHLGLSADIQLVYSPPNWDISDNSWVLNQHINVAGSVRGAVDHSSMRERANLPTETGTYIRAPSERLGTIRYVVDLNPRIVVNAHRTELLDDHQVLARFYSNKAAEALVAEDHTLAYLNSRRALQADKASSAAWNNLGVLYARAGRLDLARRAYRTAVQVDPDADSARNNLASLYRRQGDAERAAQMEARIRSRRLKNPYYHYLLGKGEFSAGNYGEAVSYYRDAIRRKRHEQLFYLSLAEAQLALDQPSEAQRSLNQARRYPNANNAEWLASLERQLTSDKQAGTAKAAGSADLPAPAFD